MEDFWPKIEDILKYKSRFAFAGFFSIAGLQDKQMFKFERFIWFFWGSINNCILSSEPDFQSTTPVIPSTDVFAISLKDPQLFDSTLRATIDSVNKEVIFQSVSIKELRFAPLRLNPWGSV